jgi:L-ascorbate metabolism protein UlaG (beta-lactamase superfamily)
MILTRLDDYQSWQVSYAGSAVLIDPWLTDHPITGSFDRRHDGAYAELRDILSGDADVVAILLCTSVNDHLRPETIQAMLDTPVLGTKASARIARRLGVRDARAVTPGDTHVFICRNGGQLTVTATRTGLPLGIIAIGWLVEAIDASGTVVGRLWIEPHQPTVATASALAPLDVAILPCEAVTAVVLPVTAGPPVAARAAGASGAHSVVPTATNPARDMSGWQRAAYRVRGGVDALQSALVTHGSTLRHLDAGESMSVTASRG